MDGRRINYSFFSAAAADVRIFRHLSAWKSFYRDSARPVAEQVLLFANVVCQLLMRFVVIRIISVQYLLYKFRRMIAYTLNEQQQININFMIIKLGIFYMDFIVKSTVEPPLFFPPPIDDDCSFCGNSYCLCCCCNGNLGSAATFTAYGAKKGQSLG